MKASQRLGRWGLVLLLGGTAGGFGLVPPAHADEPETVSIDSGSGSTATEIVSLPRRFCRTACQQIEKRALAGFNGQEMFVD